MNARPTAITVLASYLLIVFPISLVGSIYGAAIEAEPYNETTWLLLALPNVLAIAAGVSLWRMLRIGAYLWAAGIFLGWTLAIVLDTGFFPNFGAAAIVSLAIIGASVWVLAKHWRNLRRVGGEQDLEGASNA